MEQTENTLSVLKIAPGQYPQQVEIDNDLKALQQAVGGSIGASYPFEDQRCFGKYDGCHPGAGGLHRRGRFTVLRQVPQAERSLFCAG